MCRRIMNLLRHEQPRCWSYARKAMERRGASGRFVWRRAHSARRGAPVLKSSTARLPRPRQSRSVFVRRRVRPSPPPPLLLALSSSSACCRRRPAIFWAHASASA